MRWGVTRYLDIVLPVLYSPVLYSPALYSPVQECTALGIYAGGICDDVLSYLPY